MSGSGQLVSVGIVTWNSRGDIGDCLSAIDLDSGRAPHELEVVVVDNGSLDGTADWVEREHPSVRVLRNERNAGFAAAANRLVRETRGDYLLLLNPDCRLRSGYVAALIDGIEARGARCGAAGGKLVFPPAAGGDADDVIDSAGLELSLALRVKDRGHGQPDRGRFDADEIVFGVCAAAALYRRSLLADLERRTGEVFDEAFGSYKEDADLAWRARRLGWSAVYVAEAVAEHKRGFAAHRRSEMPAWLRRQSFRNRYLLLAKNATFGDVLRRLPFVAAFEFASFGYAVARDRALLGAYPAAARLVASAWPKRRLVTRQRRAAGAPARAAAVAEAPRLALAAPSAEGVATSPGGHSH